MLVTRIYVQITKTERKLFNTKHKITSGLLAVSGDLDFPIILSPSDRNMLVTRIYVQITKTERKLFNTKHKITSGLLAVSGDLDFPIIPQYNALTLQYRGIFIT